MDKFSQWNTRLLESFFSEASNGEEVFLRTDRDALDSVGQDLGGDEGFLEAVRTGPSWRRPNSRLVDRILLLVTQRQVVEKCGFAELEDPRKLQLKLALEGYIDPGISSAPHRGHAAPTYLPYLALLVRIAAVAAQSGFYKKLRETLGLNEAFDSAQMASAEAAWRDLQDWTTKRHGRFGLFTLRRLGGYSHIGVPQSQSILKSGDIVRLPLVFERAGIRPDNELGPDGIGRILREAKVEAGRAGTFLSTSFCAALEKSEFQAPLSSIIDAIYEDWDGTIPDRKSSSDTQESEDDRQQGLGLILSLVSDDPVEFAAHWTLPAIHDSGKFELQRGSASWSGAYAGSEGGLTAFAGRLDQELWNIAGESTEGDLEFTLTSRLGDETEEIQARIVLERHLLWLLVPDLNGPQGLACLREGELPGNGTAFLLAPPKNVDRLKRYLDLQKPDHDVMSAAGLPSGWLLVRLNECSSLTGSQRALPDGAETHPIPRLIRFVGGRSVRRGYGRMYLPYDLPVVELDAPQGSQLLVSEGIDLVEEVVGADSRVDPSLLFRPARRFKLHLRKSGSASYRFEVLRDGQATGRPATLRISGTDGDLIEAGKQFSLDSLGRPQGSSEGLSGVLPGQQTLAALASIGIPIQSVDAGRLGSGVSAGASEVSAEEEFLDALAQSDGGAMDAGTARRLVGRLLARAGRDENPTFFLMSLRSRGHIEVATTQKGHMSRIHSVQPTIFQLSVAADGKRVHGVLGTLRIALWKTLELPCASWRGLKEGADHARFAAFRLIELEDGAIERACSSGLLGRLGFRYARFPSLAIARWSEGLTSVRETALQNPMESIGRAADGAMRFNVVIGKFSARPAVFPLELWKTMDLDTGLGSVHYLVERENTHLRHAFVRDSRWGVWISLDARLRQLSQQMQRADIYPTPLSFDRLRKTVWLPARIGLPVVLERALVLCSGALPSELDLVQDDEMMSGERSAMRPRSGGGLKLKTSLVYQGMANGKWLAYRWVPEEVAAAVAAKLGARLDFVDVAIH